jgi:hypothetical protein
VESESGRASAEEICVTGAGGSVFGGGAEGMGEDRESRAWDRSAAALGSDESDEAFGRSAWSKLGTSGASVRAVSSGERNGRAIDEV